MRCAAFFGLVPIGQRVLRPARHPRARFVHGPVGRDQRTALGQIGAIEQAIDRDRDEIAVGDVEFAIGIGEALGFQKQVPCHRIAETERGEIEPFELAEDLQHRHAAR